jgi:hypothetical protein
VKEEEGMGDGVLAGQSYSHYMIFKSKESDIVKRKGKEWVMVC